MTSSGMPLDLPDSVLAALANEAAVESPTTPLPVPATPVPPELNKRVHHRLIVHFPYAIMLKSVSGREIRFAGYTEDISLGGVSVGASVNIPLAITVAIRIDLFCQGRREKIIAMAKCIHQAFSARLGGFCYGFQFVKMSDTCRDALARYMKSRALA